MSSRTPTARRLSTRLAARAAIALCLAACHTPARIRDQRPAAVPRDALASTIWIGFPDGERIVGYGSAVVLGPRRLLTAAHAWAVGGPKQPGELPAVRALALYRPGNEGRNALVVRDFHLVAHAAGWGEETRPEDWALVEAEEPLWPAERAAIVHAEALKTNWSPPQGAELLVAGYSSIFLRSADAARPTGETTDARTMTWRQIEPFIAAGPYTLAGRVTFVEEKPMLRYPAEWPKPGGQSGGGVYLWNEARGRAELVGVFHSRERAQEVVTERYAPFGIDALGVDRTSETSVGLLGYTPIARCLAAGP